MKTEIHLKLAVIILLAAVFTSCDKDFDDSNVPSSINPKEVVIVASEVENITNDVSGIFAQLRYTNNSGGFTGLQYLSNYAEFQGGSLMLRFPGSFPDEHLGSPLFAVWPAVKLSTYEGVTLSDMDAKTGIIYLHASNNASYNYSIGKFELGSNAWIAEFMYADRDFTAKGNSKYDIEFDCSFKKGWNVMYRKKDYSKITTEMPLNEKFKWYFFR